MSYEAYGFPPEPETANAFLTNECDSDLCSECDGKILYRGHTYDCECECHEQPISVLSDGGFDLMTL
jgi:hypothetical protein